MSWEQGQWRGVLRSHVWCQGNGGPSTVRSNASWVMVTWGPPRGHTHTQTQLWKHYLPATSLAGGNKRPLQTNSFKIKLTPVKTLTEHFGPRFTIFPLAFINKFLPTWPGFPPAKHMNRFNQFHIIQLFLKDDLKINTEGTYLAMQCFTTVYLKQFEFCGTNTD